VHVVDAAEAVIVVSSVCIDVLSLVVFVDKAVESESTKENEGDSCEDASPVESISDDSL